jgi:hypothetical protein
MDYIFVVETSDLGWRTFGQWSGIRGFRRLSVLKLDARGGLFDLPPIVFGFVVYSVCLLIDIKWRPWSARRD